MRPYTIIAFSVNGYASLTRFASLPLFRRGRIRSQQCENAMWYESRYLPIIRAMSLKTFILQSGELTRAETILEILGSETRYRSIMSTISTSRKTTPTDIRQDEIAYDLLRRAQLQSTAVNWAAPSDAESAIDENDYITPERVRLTRTQREVTRRRYLSQHGYIARSCALAFPFPGVYLSRSMCAYGGEAFCERNRATEINYTMKVHPEEMPSGEAHLRWEGGYCDRILDVRLRFRRIPTAMTAYAT
jgi:hypothetical protein